MSSLRVENQEFSLIAFTHQQVQFLVTLKLLLEVDHLLHSSKSTQSPSADSVKMVLLAVPTLLAHQDSQEFMRRKVLTTVVLLFVSSARTVQHPLAQKLETSLS